MRITKVKEASILKVENEPKYIFRHDGRDVELTAYDAFRFYSTLEGALSSKSICSLDDTLCITLPDGLDIYFEIERTQVWRMWIELKKEDETGRGYWCNN